VPEIELSTFGYGAANLGNLYRSMSDDEAASVLDAAWESGIRYFDTAPHYGLGLSERRLGAFLRTKPRDEFVLSTKVGRLLRPNPEGDGRLDTENDFVVPATLRREWDPSAVGVRASLDESLERLGLERVDIVYLHDPERYDLARGLNEAIPALAELRDAGVVGAIGVGSMSTSALLASAKTGSIDLLMVAGRLTLADQEVIPEVLDACAEQSIGIVAAAVFNSGLLASDTPKVGARYDYGEVSASLLARVQAIAHVCREFGVALPAAALQYTLREPTVRSVIVGGSRAEQVRENASRIGQQIPDQFWDRLVTDGLIPR
jgi:D-threo-aldose 1-dehydrogenase